ncbi:MAG: hypothetical protein JRI68_16030, partial [Deltaproteobacteria bacterium]|nr:hypothetical protein [Deltaproteobacteria bacterium]
MRSLLGLVGAIVFAGALGCADLDSMTEEVCGNGALDSDAVDCDPYPKSQCIQ